MKLTFAGVGSAFTTNDYYQSNMVIETDDASKKLLIDCGGDIRHALKEIDINHRDIDGVYISHLHADHIGGLEWFAFSTYFDPACERPTLYIVDELLDPLWQSLRGGLQSYEGRVLELDSYFDIKTMSINDSFHWGGVEFCPIQTIHVMNGNGILPCYGLMLRLDGGQQVFISTDTQFAPRQIEKFYAMADVIFHDCETLPFQSGVHAHFDDLKTLPDETKAKMWLYHYNPIHRRTRWMKAFRDLWPKAKALFIQRVCLNLKS